MKLKAVRTRLCQVLMAALLALLVGAVAADHPLSLPGCTDTCGNVKIPYPFGIGNSATDQRPCFFDHRFNLTCNSSKLYMGNIEVQNISLEGQMLMSFYVSKMCEEEKANEPFLQVPSFTISSRENKFITVGCDSYGYLNSYYEGATYSTGCLTRCYGNDPDMVIGNSDGRCTGLGCCQVDIPPQMKNITIHVYKFSNSTPSEKSCSYSFIAKQGSYNFSVQHLEHLPNEEFPMVVNWAVTNESCQIAQTRDDYACKKSSDCVDKDTDYGGYHCKCKEGYEGNPYLPEGCRDIDECATPNHGCISKDNCKNTDGSHTCFCLEGQYGNGTKEEGCQQRPVGSANPIVSTKVVIGVGAVFFGLFVGIS